MIVNMLKQALPMQVVFHMFRIIILEEEQVESFLQMFSAQEQNNSYSTVPIG